MENIDNINNPNYYKLDCGIESIKIIETVLETQGLFVKGVKLCKK